MSILTNRRLMLRLVLVLAALIIFAWRSRDGDVPTGPPATGVAVEEAFADHRSGMMLDAAGRVQRVLADDDEGSRHQRFILTLPSGRTVLVAHNIDLAPRVPVATGDRVAVRGQYEWNERGGVLHWTHHDPDGRHDPGWIEHEGQRYQ